MRFNFFQIKLYELGIENLSNFLFLGVTGNAMSAGQGSKGHQGQRQPAGRLGRARGVCKTNVDHIIV